MTPAEQKWADRWAFLNAFPSTNGKLVLGMWLVAVVIVVPLAMMAAGQEQHINEGVLIELLGGALGLTGIGSWQKVQKWKQMPESGAEEPPPPPSGEQAVVEVPTQPNVRVPVTPLEPSD